MAKGAVKTAAQAAANWQTAMSGGTATTKWKAGVQAYTGNPMAAAATPEAQALYAQHTQEAVASGRMAARLNAADPNMWKQNTLAASLSTGVKKGSPKYQKAAEKLQGVWAQQRQAVQGMPKGGLANAQARANAALAIMMQAFGKA